MSRSVRHAAVRLAFTSSLDMIDLVQVVGDHVSRGTGLDDDAVHWVGVAVRECVCNAIKHGNRGDLSRQVLVEFEVIPRGHSAELRIRVRDQGEGFDLDTLADPLAPENLLKASGRGMFLVKTLMDDVSLRRPPEGGMEVIMTKLVPATDSPSGSMPRQPN